VIALDIESLGAGPDLALIHGWGIGKSAWNELLPLLTPRFRVHRVELPGYGRTAGRTTDNTADYAADCAANYDPSAAAPNFIETAAAIAAALPAGCALCGWSLGALLALQAALLAPQRVKRLILCAATPSFMQREGWPHGQPMALLDGFGEALEQDAAATLQRFIALANQGDSTARANSRTLARAVASDGLPDAATLARGLDWLGDVDLREQLAAIAQPTLLIHGEIDPLMPLAAANWLAERLPNARLEIMSDAAHAPFINDPQHFAQLIDDFCHVPANH
jgi:pimeloyl-ACP methyl ester esterase